MLDFCLSHVPIDEAKGFLVEMHVRFSELPLAKDTFGIYQYTIYYLRESCQFMSPSLSILNYMGHLMSFSHEVIRDYSSVASPVILL